jgi:transposase
MKRVSQSQRWQAFENFRKGLGIILEPLPPDSPELQPAQGLWALADEPLVNKSFETLDELEGVLCQRCQILSSMPAQIQALTHYHLWPDPELLRTG